MTFGKLKKIIEREFGTSKLSDIARELNVSPQVVSNWKARGQVPYKYVRLIRKKIRRNDTTGTLLGPEKEYSNFNINEADAYKKEEDNHFDLLEILFFSLYQKIISNLPQFIFFPALLLILAFVNLKFYTIPTYTSVAKILPLSEGANSGGGVAGIASQFGINIGASGSASGLSESSMVPYIIKSRRMARNLLEDSFSTAKFGKEKKLINILFSDTLNQNFSSKQESKAINNVLEMISIKGGGVASPLIRLSVVSFEAHFSSEIANSIIENLNALMSEFKLKQVTEKKSFIDSRLFEISFKLKIAEENLRDFRKQNRSIYSSPALMLEQTRLIRDLEMFTQMHLTLVTQSEMIKIEEVSKSTMLQVLDKPEVPIKKTSPKESRVLITWMFAGLCMSFIYIFVKEWLEINWLKIVTPLRKMNN